jgi:hypothetical protein
LTQGLIAEIPAIGQLIEHPASQVPDSPRLVLMLAGLTVQPSGTISETR